MVFKKPVVTVYESEPTFVEKDVAESRLGGLGAREESPRPAPLGPNDALDTPTFCFEEAVRRFNRALLTNSTECDGGFPTVIL